VRVPAQAQAQVPVQAFLAPVFLVPVCRHDPLTITVMATMMMTTRMTQGQTAATATADN
jgi:hypothetical protein